VGKGVHVSTSVLIVQMMLVNQSASEIAILDACWPVGTPLGIFFLIYTRFRGIAVPRSGYEDDAICVNKHAPSHLMILFVPSPSTWDHQLRVRILSCESEGYLWIA
jgi:hypothetical protein